MPLMIRCSRNLAVGAAFGLALACGTSDPSGAGGAGGAGTTANPGGAGSPSTSGGPSTSDGSGAPNGSGGVFQPGMPSTSTAAELARKLGRPTNFLIGMGNDLNLNNDHSMDGAYTLGTTLDLHYGYLVAYLNMDKSWGSWKDWNPGGSFVNVLTDSADSKGVVPMFTLYAMAAYGDGNLAGLTDPVFEKGYWGDVKLLFQRIALFGKPAVVHLEPDFWAYAEQQSHDDPSTVRVNVNANAPDCAGVTDDLAGMGQCLVKLARIYAPKALVGFHASQWAGDPSAIATFLKKVGADQADLIFADLLDRDAGCFEAGTDPGCKRGGAFYWDESNVASPNFHEYLAWSKAIMTGVGRPMVWWQIPLGVPSATPGGTSGHYRDNRVHYIFSHIQEFVDAGGLGATFGGGAPNQTSIATDGDQFKNAVAEYYKHPVPLP